MSEPITHESVYELLPWYVNDTLGDSERQLVEAHVRVCLTCRLELKKENQLGQFVRSAPTVDLSPEAGFARLTRTLDTHANARNHPPERRPWSRWLSLPTMPRFVVAAFSVAAVAILVWNTIPRQAALEQPEYVTLTGDPRAANHLDVIFADRVTETQMRTLLAEIGGSIVAGPTEIGRYTVRLEGDGLDDARLTAFIRELNADDRVRFAGPASLREPTE